MADVTISSLPLGTPSGNSIIPIVNNNVTQRTTLSSLTANLTPVSSSGLAKAWVSFNGLGAIGTNMVRRSSYNIDSVYRNSAAVYTVNITPGVFTDANYALMMSSSTSLNRASWLSGPMVTPATANSFQIVHCSLVASGSPANISTEEGPHWGSIVIYGS